MSAPEAPIVALDLFAGTGWGVACQWLGIEEYGVEIMPEAVATRDANGMKTIYRDVWDGLTGKESTPNYQCLIASPPCQTFSLAGHGAGRAALDEVLEAIREEVWKDPEALIAFGEKHDPRTALVLAPLAYVWRDWPTYVAMEQVPPVLPVWEAVADVMRTLGYSVETGILNAEQYGVPQTRRRAILVARGDGQVSLPKPTHSRYYSKDPGRLDPDVLPWVSMAQALGWGMTDRPMPTITGGTHGPTDRWASGGNSVRKMIDAKVDGPDWIAPEAPATVDSRTEYAVRIDVAEASALQSYPPVEAVKHMGAGMVARHGDRPGRGADEPAFTVRASAGGTEPGGFQLRNTETGDVEKLEPEQAAALQTYPQGWGFTDRPAVTISNAVGRGLCGGSGARETVERALEDGTFIPSPNGHGDDYAEKTRITVDEAATLQSYPKALRSNYGGTNGAADRGQRQVEQPAPTVTSKADRNKWDGERNMTEAEAAALQSYPPGRGLTNRPSPTITGGGTETGGAEPIAKLDRYTGSPDWTGSKERLSTDEAAALQSYPVYRSGNQDHSTKRAADQPAPTIHFGERSNKVEWMDPWNADDPKASGERVTPEQAAALQTYPQDELPIFRSGHRPNAAVRPITHPAPTIIAGHDVKNRGFEDDSPRGVRPMTEAEAAALQSYPPATFPLYTQNIRQANQARRPLDQPAPTVTAGHDSSNRGFIGDDGSLTVATPEEVAALQSYPPGMRPELTNWPWIDAPATTVAGDPRITAREHHYHGDQARTSLRLTEPEASTLQTYPPRPFVWCGSKSKKFLQIGNAVPPLLAYAILRTLLAPLRKETRMEPGNDRPT